MTASSARVALSCIVAVSLCASAGCGDEDRRVPLNPSLTQVPVPSPAPPPAPRTPQAIERTITGRVREANGPPLAGVEIFGLVRSARVDLGATAQDGSFRVERVTGEWLLFERPGYARMTWSVPAGANSDVLDIEVKIQPILIASEVMPLSGVITRDDVTYSTTIGDAFADGDYACGPCKLIAIADATPTITTFRLTWSGDLPLILWAGPDGWEAPDFFSRLAGESEIRGTIRGASKSKTVLVGVDPRDAGRVTGTIAFRLEVQSR